MTALISALLFYACAIISPGTYAYGLVVMTNPPEWYRTEYEAMEDCTGFKGDYDRMMWMAADSIRDDGEPANAVVYPSHHIIIVARDALDRKPTIRHEAIHDIIGGGGHPTVIFDKCAPESNYPKAYEEGRWHPETYTRTHSQTRPRR